ncbi:MAG: hypothetical protein HC817_02325 [Saprospiraceae bacterium]|nr:hypothetical protein [Saprospiraceae bacterium]
MKPILQTIYRQICPILLVLVYFVLPTQFLKAQTTCTGVGGKVFADYNFDGFLNETTIGIEGVKVYVFTSYGTTDSTLTDTDGFFSFPALMPLSSARVEIVLPAALNATKITRSAVQFVVGASCNVNFGVAVPSDYCQANPHIIVPCYVNGDPRNSAGSAKDSVALVAVPFNVPNAAPTSSELPLLNAGAIGSVWGVAYHKHRKALITTAVLKRHVGFGAAGAGGVYFLNYQNPNSVSVMGSLSLSAGVDPRATEPLPADPTQPSNDVAAFDKIGKMGLGGVAVSDDGNTLFVMNLATQKLVKINLSNFNITGSLPTSSDILSEISMPSPCGTEGVFRAWAVKSHQGKIYMGGVCDASISKDTNDLHAYIYELSGTNLTPVFDFSLNYQRGYATSFVTFINRWFPWEDDYTKMLRGDLQFVYPQPILSDIEFDIDGSLILGFMDRMGHQGGYQNYVPRPNFPFIRAITISAGDIVRVCKKNGVFFF